ncbi:hypothetical protein [Alkaliphilus crotonatoxidans]
MKLLRKPIEILTKFDPEGNGRPVRFRFLNEDDEYTIIKVDRVIKRELDKFAGNTMIKYTCETCIQGEIKLFELRHEINTSKWYLYKI